MIISYKDVRTRVQSLWPGCKNVWLDDPEYFLPSLEDIRIMLAKDHTERLEMRGTKFDCDDFALQLAASVSRMWANDPNNSHPIPFGQVRGRKFQHLKESHKCNICVLEDQIILIEPQTDQIFIADPIEDSVFFVGVPS